MNLPLNVLNSHVLTGTAYTWLMIKSKITFFLFCSFPICSAQSIAREIWTSPEMATLLSVQLGTESLSSTWRSKTNSGIGHIQERVICKVLSYNIWMQCPASRCYWICKEKSCMRCFLWSLKSIRTLFFHGVHIKIQLIVLQYRFQCAGGVG